MLLNRIEFALVNNPVRSAIQSSFEAARLLRMGGDVRGGRVLEIGCGGGTGVSIILKQFGAAAVDAFDLDPRMVARAVRRHARHPSVHLWVADCTAIPVPDAVYDAVFDFAIIHHVPDWRAALREVARVLKPGGRFYAEEALGRLITHPVTRIFLDHPQLDRFEAPDFERGLADAGLVPHRPETLWGAFGWFFAVKSGAGC
jgi:ubiquinone/menaquinone biosynthesis C-methylase UbiE